MLAILCGVGGIWWNSHTKSPEYVAGQKLKQADKAAAAGNGGESARLYREVMESNTSHSESARGKFATIIEIRGSVSRHIISVLVENEAGALSRIAGLFSARGYNIENADRGADRGRLDVAHDDRHQRAPRTWSSRSPSSSTS